MEINLDILERFWTKEESQKYDQAVAANDKETIAKLVAIGAKKAGIKLNSYKEAVQEIAKKVKSILNRYYANVEVTTKFSQVTVEVFGKAYGDSYTKTLTYNGKGGKFVEEHIYSKDNGKVPYTSTKVAEFIAKEERLLSAEEQAMKAFIKECPKFKLTIKMGMD